LIKKYYFQRFNESELKALFDLITRTKELNIALCFLLIYPTIYEQNFQSIVKWIIDNFQLAPQNLLLIAIFCSSNQLPVNISSKKKQILIALFY
jgi:hypothetical protein